MTTSKELNDIQRRIERRDKVLYRLEIAACFIGICGIAAFALFAVSALSNPLPSLSSDPWGSSGSGDDKSYTLYKDGYFGISDKVDSGLTREDCKRQKRSMEQIDSLNGYECEAE